MPRNLDHRVEIAFPVLDARLQAQIHEVLELQLGDTVKAREILLDGSSARVAGRRGSAAPIPGAALRAGRRGRPRLALGRGASSPGTLLLALPHLAQALVVRHRIAGEKGDRLAG